MLPQKVLYRSLIKHFEAPHEYEIKKMIEKFFSVPIFFSYRLGLGQEVLMLFTLEVFIVFITH